MPIPDLTDGQKIKSAKEYLVAMYFHRHINSVCISQESP